MKLKRGLSTIVSTLLILLLVFVAVAILWVVVRNVIQSGTEQVSLGKFTLDLKIDQVIVNENLNQVLVKVKRNQGQGEFVGLKIIISDDDDSEIFNENVSLDVYEKRTFTLNLLELNSSKINKIQIVPIFLLSSGKQAVGDVKDTWEKSLSSSSYFNENLPSENETGQECTSEFEDINCTTDYSSSTTYCGTDENVYRNLFDFYCNTLSKCTYSIIPQLVENCTASGKVCDSVTKTCVLEEIPDCQNGETRNCEGSHGTGIQTCTSETWGICVLNDCDNGYIPSGNGCVVENPETCIHYDGVCGTGCNSLSDHDCFANEHLGWIVFELKDENDYTNKRYIDPSWTGCESGTILCPYNSWTDVTWQSNTAYIQKRGTTQTVNAQFEIPNSISNIYIGAYGIGVRPVLIGTYNGNFFNVHATYVLFRDINLQTPGNTLVPEKKTFYIRGDASNFVIYNCTLANAGFDALWSWASGTKVLYTEIYNVYEDGIAVGNAENIEVAYNNIHDVNTAWYDYGSDQSKASGDAIQFLATYDIGVDKWWVHHNLMDRSNSGNKFCFHASGEEATFGIFEYNTLSGPRTDGHGGASFYIPQLWDEEHSVYFRDTHVIVRNNLINGPSPSGIYSETNNLLVENNVFDGVTNAIQNSGSGLKILNNQFSNIFGDCFTGTYAEQSGNTGDCP